MIEALRDRGPGGFTECPWFVGVRNRKDVSLVVQRPFNVKGKPEYLSLSMKLNANNEN